MNFFEDKKKLVIIGLSVILIIIIALIIWWLTRPKPEVIVSNTTGTSAEIPVTTNEPAIVEPATQAQVQEANSYPLGLKQLAMAFAERYGSYSSDEPTKNLSDLAPYMTSRLAQELAAKDFTSGNTGTFSGYTTKALSTELSNVSASSAEIIVKVQRTQTVDRTIRTYYADLKLTAITVGGEWKIDSASWK